MVGRQHDIAPPDRRSRDRAVPGPSEPGRGARVGHTEQLRCGQDRLPPTDPHARATKCSPSIRRGGWLGAPSVSASLTRGHIVRQPDARQGRKRNSFPPPSTTDRGKAHRRPVVRGQPVHADARHGRRYHKPWAERGQEARLAPAGAPGAAYAGLDCPVVVNHYTMGPAMLGKVQLPEQTVGSNFIPPARSG